MTKRRRIRRKRKHGILSAAVIAAFLAAVAVKTDKAVRPVAEMQAESHASAFANKIISSAVSEYIDKKGFAYSDFAAVLYDENGTAVSVEAIPLNINRVQSELTYTINRRLNTSEEKSEIAIGSLTGSYMLVGKGPHIKLRVCPNAKASVELKSSFNSAGINQTCHRISAVVTADIHSSVPLYSFDSTVSFEFLLAENILVGDVPEISRYAWNSI